jgi:hypothetical protein
MIHDVSIHAKGTHDNLDRLKSKLFLRKKYKDKMTPKADLKIWQYETRSLVADLKFSRDKLVPIIKKIDKL